MSENFKIPLLILVILLTWNINTLLAQEVSKGFYFSIESANDSYNSKTREFKRLYQEGTKVFNIKLTDKEISNIYILLGNANFPTLPSTYKAKSEMQMLTTPSFEYLLEANFDGVLKKIIYNSRITDAEMLKDVAPFLKLHQEIWEIIYLNAEVQKIKESNVFWE